MHKARMALSAHHLPGGEVDSIADVGFYEKNETDEITVGFVRIIRLFRRTGRQYR